MNDLPNKWKKSAKSIRAVQLAFEFSKTVAEVIRHQANKQGLSPSDQIRSIIGLQPKIPKRPRLTVSLSEPDYEILANRYNLPLDDKAAIRKAIADELIAYSQSVPQPEEPN
jgi:hypothetical protein